MATWPAIKKPLHPLGEASEDVSIRSKQESGHVISRARFTKARQSWALRWSALSEADYQTLLTFWNSTVRGGSDSFDWTHPVSSTVFTVRFATEKLAFETVPVGHRSGEVILEEV